MTPAASASLYERSQVCAFTEAHGRSLEHSQVMLGLHRSSGFAQTYGVRARFCVGIDFTNEIKRGDWPDLMKEKQAFPK